MSDTHDDQRGQPSNHFDHDIEHSYNGGVERELSVKLGEFSRALQQLNTPEEITERIVRGALELIPGADDGSVSVAHRHRYIESYGAPGQLPALVDAAQNQTGEGPILDAAYRHRTIRIEDMHTEARWPQFAQRAANCGALSMLAIQLYVEEDNLGALSLFSRTPRAFTDQSEEIGLLVAEQAAVAMATERKLTQLAQALSSRDLIGQAKGILMERYKLHDDAAFALLAKASQDHNLKLRDVAEKLTSTGELPGSPYLAGPQRL